MQNEEHKQGTLGEVACSTQSEFEFLVAYIKQLVTNKAVDEWKAALESADVLLTFFKGASADHFADQAWFIKNISHTRFAFIKAFGMIKAGKFYDAWCELERIEIDIIDLFKNPFYDLADFGVEELRDLVADLQSLFPYKVFFSPEMIIKKEVCNFCGNDVHPWSTCTHKIGHVYGGRLCYRIVKECEAVSISIVVNPVQKYSVPFLTDDNGKPYDHYDYSVVRFLVERLASPFDRWSFEWTKAFHPHNLFSDIKSNEPCPCDSGQIYEICCQSKPGVMQPHIQFSFEKPPPENLPNAYLAGYGEKNQSARLFTL